MAIPMQSRGPGSPTRVRRDALRERLKARAVGPSMLLAVTTPRRRWSILSLFLLGSLIAAAVGGWVTSRSIDTWYAALAKPSWNPPNAIFAPVWTALYIMMAIAGWRATLHALPEDRATLVRWYVAQLILNTAWSFLFFGLRHPLWALIDITVLWCVLAILQRVLWRADRLAALLWIPYLAWVTFATALNAAIWRLN